MPLTHSVHPRFAVALGAEVCPSPVAQVDQAMQAVCVPASGAYWLLGHAAHVRSTLAVGAVLVYWPTGHEAVIAAHAASESASEYVVPLTHAVHPRLAVALPAVDCPWPAAHVCHVVQLVAPAALN